ncbi:MAG: DUF2442 domain-containing protein [Acidobacteriota bacterium]
MSSSQLGADTLEAEVTNISRHGVWILVGDRELFMSYESFPWFHQAAVEAIFEVEQPTPGHLYWPQLDVDLSLETIEHPERFPLIAR